jgi:hypothetical protein
MSEASSGSAPRGPSELYRKLVEGKISSKDYLSKVKKSSDSAPQKKSESRPRRRLNGTAGATLAALLVMLVLPWLV